MAGDSPPRVSVIVVALNAAETIRETLESLQNQTYANYEVIVVDGGSTDATREVVREYDAKLIRDDGGTIGRCRNVGIDNATGEYVAFTDSDCAAPTDWLERLVQRLGTVEDDTVAGVGGTNRTFESDSRLAKVIEAMQETTLSSGRTTQTYVRDGITEVSSVPACNAMYRAAVFDSHRFADISVGEDLEFHHRLTRRRYTFYFDPSIKVEHHRPGSTREFASKMLAYGKAMAIVCKRHRSIVRWYAVLPPASLLAAPLVLRYALRSKRRLLALSLVSLVGVAWPSIHTFKRTGDPLSASVLYLFPVQVLAYGAGFLYGAVSDH